MALASTAVDIENFVVLAFLWLVYLFRLMFEWELIEKAELNSHHFWLIVEQD